MRDKLINQPLRNCNLTLGLRLTDLPASNDIGAIKAWFPLVLRIVRIGNSYDFPTLGFLRLLRFLGQAGLHSSGESPTARGIYL